MLNRIDNEPEWLKHYLKRAPQLQQYLDQANKVSPEFRERIAVGLSNLTKWGTSTEYKPSTLVAQVAIAQMRYFLDTHDHPGPDEVMRVLYDMFPDEMRLK